MSSRKLHIGFVTAALYRTVVKVTICRYLETEFTSYHYTRNEKKKLKQVMGNISLCSELLC
jgi:hypothetical protein